MLTGGEANPLVIDTDEVMPLPTLSVVAPARARKDAGILDAERTVTVGGISPRSNGEPRNCLLGEGLLTEEEGVACDCGGPMRGVVGAEDEAVMAIPRSAGDEVEEERDAVDAT